MKTESKPGLPLESVRVLAVEQYGAGPFGTMSLADLGADVVKIEDRKSGGDFARSIGPYFVPGDDGDESEFFHSYNRNKRSFTVDLTTEAGQLVFHDLVKSADVVASNLRGDVPEKLGLTYAALKSVNTKIVCGLIDCRSNDRTWLGVYSSRGCSRRASIWHGPGFGCQPV